VIHHSIKVPARLERVRPALSRSWVRLSLGGVGACYDYALRESFFATLERGAARSSAFCTQHAAEQAVLDVNEGWSNPHHPPSALGQP
jgi:putative transposase